MTPVEWVIAGIAVLNFLVGTIGAAIWKTQRDKVKSDELRTFIDTVVKSAEEKQAAGEFKKGNKQDWVWGKIEEYYPKFAKNEEWIQVLIDAACQAAGVGASGKNLVGRKGGS